MSNIVYLDGFYNEEIKKEFISEYGEATQKTIARIFKVSNKSESDLNKDLYDFTREEIRKLLFLYSPKTVGSSNLNVTWISKYIDWAIENEYLQGTSPLDGINKEWAAQFVGTNLKKFWTESEITNITQKLENAQDAVGIRLLFESVRGSGNSELLNLRQKDVLSFENKLRLYDSVTKNERVIDVSDKLIKLCEAALRETEYIKSNGNPSKDLKASPTAHLVANDYVIKSSLTRTDHHHEADTHIIHRRLTNLAEEMGEPNFTPLQIVYSGQLYLGYLLYNESGQLGDKEYREIFQRFGEESTQVQTRIKNEFLNLETIKKLYELS